MGQPASSAACQHRCGCTCAAGCCGTLSASYRQEAQASAGRPGRHHRSWSEHLLQPVYFSLDLQCRNSECPLPTLSLYSKCGARLRCNVARQTYEMLSLMQALRLMLARRMQLRLPPPLVSRGWRQRCAARSHTKCSARRRLTTSSGVQLRDCFRPPPWRCSCTLQRLTQSTTAQRLLHQHPRQMASAAAVLTVQRLPAARSARWSRTAMSTCSM